MSSTVVRLPDDFAFPAIWSRSRISFLVNTSSAEDFGLVWWITVSRNTHHARQILPDAVGSELLVELGLDQLVIALALARPPTCEGHHRALIFAHRPGGQNGWICSVC